MTTNATGAVWYSGCWRTPEGVERRKAQIRNRLRAYRAAARARGLCQLCFKLPKDAVYENCGRCVIKGRAARRKHELRKAGR